MIRSSLHSMTLNAIPLGLTCRSAKQPRAVRMSHCYERHVLDVDSVSCKNLSSTISKFQPEHHMTMEHLMDRLPEYLSLTSTLITES